VTPDQWTEISSWGLMLWAIATTVLFLIQLLAWPDDRQKWAASLAVLTLGVVLWRLWLVYRFNLMLGGTEQGIVFFLVAAVAWAGLAYESWEMNRGRYGPRLQQITRRWKRKR